VIDGGRGQLERIARVLADLNIVGIDLIGLAKRRRKKRLGRVTITDERIFHPGHAAPTVLQQDSPENYLIVRIRDEAHRFAVTYHRSRRNSSSLRSSLDQIPGIGPKRKKALIDHFGSPRAVSAASIEELRSVAGLGEAAARAVFEHFRSGTSTGAPAEEVPPAASQGSPDE